MRTTAPIQSSIHFLNTMIKKGGPQPHDYPFFNQVLENLSNSIESKEVSKEDLKPIYQLFDGEFLEKSVHGHSFRKPFGYAGDFLVIDKVYQKEIHPEYKRWDEFILNHRTCDGIRNRKEYFKNLLTHICQTSNLAKIDLLNVASGPARDLLELYTHCEETERLYTDCVEYDPNAITYAKKLTQAYNQQISYENGNIYTYQTDKKYDVIWSSGLFDYFNDKVFVSILKKFLSWAKPTSKIVLGNVCPAHSLKEYMEILMDWSLYIRTSKDLIRLATEAGVNPKNVKIGIEEAGIFLFLHIEVE